MTNWVVGIIIGVVALIIALCFEESRDWLGDTFEYLISFEWGGDAWDGITDFFGAMFEGLWDFSIMGLSFALMAVGVSYGTRYLNLNGSGMGVIESMTQYMPPGQKLFWTFASYLGAFIGGYLLGKRFENT